MPSARSVTATRITAGRAARLTVLAAAVLAGSSLTATAGADGTDAPRAGSEAFRMGALASWTTISADESAASQEDLDADAESAADTAADPEPDPEGVDDSGAGSADGSDSQDADDLFADDDGDAAITAVVIDVMRRTVSGPKVFAPSRRVKISGVTWSTWGAQTTTGRGRVVVKKKSRRAKTLRATGTVVLSGLITCPDATPLYRKATVTVGGRRVAKVSLPGCSAMR